LKTPLESTSSTYQTIIDDSNDPAPANVVSDVTIDRRKTKGLLNAPQISRNEPQVKRQRPITSKEPIDVSEDELQIAEVTPSGPVRRTNFSNITVSPRHKRLRGDIVPTNFSKAKNGRDQSKLHLEIRKAVSGKCTYRADGSSPPPILLRQSPDNPLLLETIRNGKRDKQHPWLSIETKKVGKVHFHGRQILLHRSISPGTYPKLAIEFATGEEADLLLSIIGGEAIECSSDHMDRMVEIAWNDAKKCQKDARKTDVLRQRDAAPGEDIDEPEVNRGSKEKQSTSETRGEKLKDKMTRGNATAEVVAESFNGQDDSNSPDNQRRRSTRSAKKSLATRDPTDRDSYKWSEVNKEWEKDWKQTLVYPTTGRNRTSVEFDDISRLDNGEFVNDNVLSFYIRYVQDKMAQERPDLVSRVHIFSTFFYEKLNIEGGMNYAGVRSWTNKVDIFSYDYNIIPVNESNHWYLAIICHAPQLIEMTKRDATTINDEEDEEVGNGGPEMQEKPRSPEMANVESQMSDISLRENLGTRRTTRQVSSGLASSSPAPIRSRETNTPDSPRRNKGRKTVSRTQDPAQPRILILDSFGATHDSTRRVLKDYLVEEALDKKKMNLTHLPAGAATVVPQQSNFCDCGVFAMGYVEQFLKNPDEASRLLVLKQTTGWPIDPPKLRTKVRNLIFDLQKEQTERLAEEKEEKRRAAKERKAAARLKAADTNSSASSSTDKAAKTEDVGEAGSKNQSPEEAATPTNDKPLLQTGPDRNSKVIKDDSGASVEAKSEEFYSAKSSPEQEQNQNQTRSFREKKPATSRQQSPVFVKPLPCSSDVDDDDKSNVDGTQDSIEILEMKRTPRPPPSGRSQSKRSS
jgi:sentrin-specific protease 7